jgi:hypothetical protein
VRLAPAEQRSVRLGALQAATAAIVAIVVLTFAAPIFNDGLLAILKPVRAWQGTLLPKISFTNLPPAILRGETLRLKIAAARRGTVMLSQRIPGEAWATQTSRWTGGRRKLDVGPLRGDLTIVAVTAGREVIRPSSESQIDRSSARWMRATYPSYLGRQAEEDCRW